MLRLFKSGHRDADVRQPRRDSSRDRTLPVEAKVERRGANWLIRLPVRAEQLTVEKRLVPIEQVAIGVARRADPAHLQDTARREELHVDADE